MFTQPSGRVVIVGAGMVGSSAAYAIVNQNIAREVLLIDIAEELVASQVLDLEDASVFTYTTKVKVADYSDLVDGDIVVITSGSAQRDGMRRLDLLNINAAVIRSITENIRKTSKQVYILMVTNPVDILTYIVTKESGLPQNMIFGSGTYLDTARLQLILAKKLNVNPNNISAFVFGEHGDSSFPILGAAAISGVKLDRLLTLDDTLYEELATEVRQRAYEIIKGKKSTHFGIGAVVASMCRMIIRNENRIIPLTGLLEGHYGHTDVCCGVTAKLGAGGYEIYSEIPFNDKERELMDISVKILKDKYSEISR